jgi:hypothetical protein
MKKTLLISLLILPVFFNAQISRITYFNATPLGDTIRLNLTISAGVSCSGFEVHKGSDSMNLSPIYIYPGLCGNTSNSESHVYYDISPNNALPNYYRILIPPGDYSKIIRVDLASSSTGLLIYPQPAEDYLNISVNNNKNFDYEMRIADRFGRYKGLVNGHCNEFINLNISAFPEGIYVFYIIDNAGNYWRGKFLKQAAE